MTRSKTLVGLLLVFAVLAVGCGRGPKLVPVTGTVRMDGQPLADAMVTFVFTEYPRPAAGRTNENGEFKLTYHNREGAPIGSCKVIVSKQGKSPESESMVELVPGRFNSNTQLKVDITKEGPNNIPLELSSEPSEADGGRREQAPPQREPSDDEGLEDDE